MRFLFLGAGGLLQAGMRPFVMQDLYYYAWRWEKWRKLTGAQPPQIKSDQAGKTELVDLL